MPLPNPDNILRIRRASPTRLESFVDAAFAFAITLVVISVGHLPTSVPDMLQALRGVPTFALCFFMIARIWSRHRAWSLHYDLEDGYTLRLSLLLVFLVLVYVYPLRLLLSIMMDSLSGGVLVEQPVVVHEIWELRAAYVVFGIGYAGIALVFVALYRHTLRVADGIGLDAAERLVTRMTEMRWCGVLVVAVFSAVLACVLPFDAGTAWMASIPGFAYWLLFFNVALLRRRYSARLAGLDTAAAV